MQDEVAEFLSAEAPKYIKQMPVISISGGKVSIKEQVPFFISDPEKNTPFAIIDTSGQITSLEKTSASILLTESQVIVKNSASTPHSFTLEGIDAAIDQKALSDWIESFKTLFPFFIFPFVLFFSFLYHLIQILLAAGMGILFAKKFGTALSYKVLVRLTAVAFTPAILLQSVHSLLDVSFPYRAPISFVITLGYLYYAVGCNSTASVPNSSAS